MPTTARIESEDARYPARSARCRLRVERVDPDEATGATGVTEVSALL